MKFLFSSMSLFVFFCSSQASADFKFVINGEGIPAYTEPMAEEVFICGQVPYGTYLEVRTAKNGFLKVESSSQPSQTCPQGFYVQEGFLLSALYAGPSTRSKVQKWKSEVPHFKTQCKSREHHNKILVSFVGDLLLHGRLQRQAYSHPEGFKSLWSKLTPSFQDADLAYANLEGPVAENTDCRGRERVSPPVLSTECRKRSSSVYTSYPMFNYHPMLVPNLLQSGFDVVSTANNHVLDRYAVGADKTIEALETYDLPFTGSRRSHSRKDFHTVTSVTSKTGEEFRVAWLACTFSANGFRDKNNQVLNCFQYAKNGNPTSRINPHVLEIVNQLSNDPNVDGIIVTPHWGPTEYVHTVHPTQLKLGQALIDAGATAVIGAHPHVLQPWEVYKTSEGREGLIHYSLGNFVSNQRQTARRASVVLVVGFQKNNKGKLAIDGVRYIPTYMDRWNQEDMTLLPLNQGEKLFKEGQASLKNILSIYPEELRLNTYDSLTSCAKN